MNSRRDISFWVGIRSSGEGSTVGSLSGWPSSIPMSTSASRVFSRESLSWLGSKVEASWAEGRSLSAMAVKFFASSLLRGEFADRDIIYISTFSEGYAVSTVGLCILL